jgi:hypothetical protein
MPSGRKGRFKVVDRTPLVEGARWARLSLVDSVDRTPVVGCQWLVVS